MRSWLGVACVLIVACGGSKQKSPEELKKEYGPRVKARLEKIKAAAEAADAESLSAGEPPAGESLALDFNSGATNNAIVVHRQDAIELDRDPEIELRYIEPILDRVRIAKRLGGVITDNTSSLSGAEQAIDELTRAKYVLFAVPRNVVLPHRPLTGGDFNRGEVDGVAVLYEIDGTKLVGKFPFHAQNKEEVLVKKLKEGTSGAGAEVDRELTRDLQAQMGRAVSEGIEKRWVGAKAPWNWGYGY